jgi:glutamate formiminotransferase/formiminotetrahydrofolate cyclodeaminase
MQLAYGSMSIIQNMAINGNPNSVSDAGVGALCARTAVFGAWLNVKINCSGYDDKAYVEQMLKSCDELVAKTTALEAEILAAVHKVIEGE